MEPLPRSADDTRSLLAAREKFYRIFMSIPAGIAITDPRDGRILEVNPEFVRIFGYPIEDVVGRTTFELGLWHDLADRERLLAELEAAGELRDVELRLHRSTGDIVLIRAAFQLMATDTGQVLLATFTDVTARRQLEDAHRLSERNFATIFRESPVALAVSEFGTGRFVNVNPALLRMMRAAAPDQMLGRTSIEIGMISTAHRRRLLEASFDQHEKTVIVPMHRLDGSPFTAELSLAQYEVDGQRYLLTSLVDITPRLRAETERREAEQQYRELVEGVRDAVFSMTPQGILTSLNPAFEQITGLPRSEWIGKHFEELLHPDDVTRAHEELRAALHGRHAANPPLRVRTAAGDYRFVDFAVTARRENGRLVSVLGIGRDLSERIELEAQFQQAQKMEAVGRLAGGVAHDFNNLLTVIVGTGQLLLDQTSQDRQEYTDLEAIVSAGDRAADLTRQLLAFSRRQIHQPRTLDLNATLATAQKLLGRLLGEDVTLVTRFGPALGSVLADPGQMEQVIINLAVNARDAMPEGGTLTISTANVDVDDELLRRHPGLVAGPHVLLAVKDSGTGMTDEVKSRIFEPFFTTKESGKGTGLGLSTVYGIVAQSGGLIWVDSAAGRGSTFTICLPCIDVEGERGERTAEPAGDFRGFETVLVTEDSAAVRAMIVRVLSGLGYKVLSAATPADALRIAERHEGVIDLLLTDIVMPGMSGFALSARLSAARPDLRVLFCSGYSDDAAGRDRRLQPDTPFIQKPFTPAALARVVRQALAAAVPGDTAA